MSAVSSPAHAVETPRAWWRHPAWGARPGRHVWALGGARRAAAPQRPHPGRRLRPLPAPGAQCLRRRHRRRCSPTTASPSSTRPPGSARSAYPWGWPLLLAPFVKLWGYDYDKLKLLEVACVPARGWCSCTAWCAGASAGRSPSRSPPWSATVAGAARPHRPVAVGVPARRERSACSSGGSTGSGSRGRLARREPARPRWCSARSSPSRSSSAARPSSSWPWSAVVQAVRARGRARGAATGERGRSTRIVVDELTSHLTALDGQSDRGAPPRHRRHPRRGRSCCCRRCCSPTTATSRAYVDEPHRRLHRLAEPAPRPRLAPCGRRRRARRSWSWGWGSPCGRRPGLDGRARPRHRWRPCSPSSTHFRMVDRYYFQVLPWVLYFATVAVLELLEAVRATWPDVVVAAACRRPIALLPLVCTCSPCTPRCCPATCATHTASTPPAAIQVGPTHPDFVPIYAAVAKYTQADRRRRVLPRPHDDAPHRPAHHPVRRASNGSSATVRRLRPAAQQRLRASRSSPRPKGSPSASRSIWEDDTWVLWRVPPEATRRGPARTVCSPRRRGEAGPVARAVDSLGAVPTPDAADHPTDPHQPERGSALDVSVVLPVYNERGHLRDRDRPHPRRARRVAVHLRDRGGRRRVERRVRALDLPTIEGIRLIRHTFNRGSGAARRTGTTAARGRVVVWTDVDMTYPERPHPRARRRARRLGPTSSAPARTEQGTLRAFRVPAKWFIRKLASLSDEHRHPRPQLRTPRVPPRRRDAVRAPPAEGLQLRHDAHDVVPQRTATASSTCRSTTSRAPAGRSSTGGRTPAATCCRCSACRCRTSRSRCSCPSALVVVRRRAGEARLRLGRQGLPPGGQHACSSCSARSRPSPSACSPTSSCAPPSPPRRCPPDVSASATPVGASAAPTAATPTGNTYDKYASTNPVEQKHDGGLHGEPSTGCSPTSGRPRHILESRGGRGTRDDAGARALSPTPRSSGSTCPTPTLAGHVARRRAAVPVRRRHPPAVRRRARSTSCWRSRCSSTCPVPTRPCAELARVC
jgi:hypothetical protein